MILDRKNWKTLRLNQFKKYKKYDRTVCRQNQLVFSKLFLHCIQSFLHQSTQFVMFPEHDLFQHILALVFAATKKHKIFFYCKGYAHLRRNEIETNLHYTRGRPRYYDETSAPISAAYCLGNTAAPKKRRSGGEPLATLSDFTSLKTETMTSHADSDIVTPASENFIEGDCKKKKKLALFEPFFSLRASLQP